MLPLLNKTQISYLLLVEDATWLSPIVVVLKKNGKFIICVDFKKLNAAIKKISSLVAFHR
jgi:hypothetical protein